MADSGTHTVTEKRLPFTSTSTSRRTFGSASSSPDGAALTDADGRTGRASSSTHLVECVDAGEVGVVEDGEVGGDRRGDPLDLELAERADACGRSRSGDRRPSTTSLPTRLS